MPAPAAVVAYAAAAAVVEPAAEEGVDWGGSGAAATGVPPLVDVAVG